MYSVFSSFFINLFIHLYILIYKNNYIQLIHLEERSIDKEQKKVFKTRFSNMPVTEIDKKNQSLDQQSQSQSQSQPSSSQSLQQQEDSQQLPDAEDIESTNNLIDSLTTQQQQEQLFNKLQQLHQLRNQDFVSDDEITQSHITDNSTYYGPLHDKFFPLAIATTTPPTSPPTLPNTFTTTK